MIMLINDRLRQWHCFILHLNPFHYLMIHYSNLNSVIGIVLSSISTCFIISNNYKIPVYHIPNLYHTSLWTLPVNLYKIPSCVLPFGPNYDAEAPKMNESQQGSIAGGRKFR